MSKFNCEYCGSLIDTEIDINCPNCGASYSDNQDYEEIQNTKRAKEDLENQKAAVFIEERKENLKRQKIENQDYQNEVNRQNEYKNAAGKTGKIISIFLILIVVLVITSVIAGMVIQIVKTAGEDYLSYADRHQGSSQGTVYKKIEADFDEFASNGTISVKVDKVEEFDPSPNNNERGYVSVAIHLAVRNDTEKDYYNSPEVTVLADGYLAEKISDTYNYKLLSSATIPEGAMQEGYLLYKIPTSAETLTVMYGDYIVLGFENPVKE